MSITMPLLDAPPCATAADRARLAAELHALRNQLQIDYASRDEQARALGYDGAAQLGATPSEFTRACRRMAIEQAITAYDAAAREAWDADAAHRDREEVA